MVDFSLLGELWELQEGISLNKSDVDWDWTILQPKILLDDKVLADRGIFFLD